MNKYTTKLTADTTQHDGALNNSANQIYKYKKRVEEANNSGYNFNDRISKIKGNLGKFSIVIGAASVGAKFFEKTIRSTEQTSDKLDNTIYATKTTINEMFYAINNNNCRGFLSNMDEIIKAAQEASEALDDLGDKKIWANIAKGKLEADMSKARAIISSPKATKKEKEDAQHKLDLADAQYKALTNNLTNSTQDAIYKVVNKIAGGNYAHSDIDKLLSIYTEIREKGGGLEEVGKIAEAIKRQHSETAIDYMLSGDTYYRKKYLKWDDPKAEKAYNLYNAFFTKQSAVNEELIPLLNDYNTYNKEQSDFANKVNKQLNKNLDGGTTKETARQINDRITEQFGTPVKLNFDIDTDTIIDTIDNAIKETPIKLELELDTSIEAEIAKDIDKFDDWMQSIENTSSLVNDLGNAFRSLGGAFEMPMLDVTGIISQSVATMIASYAQALKSVSLLGPWAWVSFGLTGLAQLGAMVEAVKGMSKFADGGIIGGNTTVGDFGLARVNAGEMVLNQREQTRLWNVLNGSSMSTNTINGDVRFEIDGSKLVGVLNNYNNKKRRVI